MHLVAEAEFRKYRNASVFEGVVHVILLLAIGLVVLRLAPTVISYTYLSLVISYSVFEVVVLRHRGKSAQRVIALDLEMAKAIEGAKMRELYREIYKSNPETPNFSELGLDLDTTQDLERNE